MNFKIYFLTRVRFIFFRLFYLILRTQLFATFYFYFENCSRSIWPKNRLFYFVFNINLKNKEIRISMIKITIFVQLSLICKSFKCLVLDLEYKWKSEEPNHWKGNSWLHYMSMFGISNIFLYLKIYLAHHHDLEFSQDTIVQCEDGSLPLPSLLLGRPFHIHYRI